MHIIHWVRMAGLADRRQVCHARLQRLYCKYYNPGLSKKVHRGCPKSGLFRRFRMDCRLSHETKRLSHRFDGRTVATDHPPYAGDQGRPAAGALSSPRKCEWHFLRDPQRRRVAGDASRSAAVSDCVSLHSTLAARRNLGANSRSPANESPATGWQNPKPSVGIVHSQSVKSTEHGGPLGYGARKKAPVASGTSRLTRWDLGAGHHTRGCPGLRRRPTGAEAVAASRPLSQSHLGRRGLRSAGLVGDGSLAVGGHNCPSTTRPLRSSAETVDRRTNLLQAQSFATIVEVARTHAGK